MKVELVFEQEITLESVKSSTNELFKKFLIYKNMEYPDELPEHLKENMPGLFLPENAPEELKEMFYKRRLDRTIFVSNPEYKKYFDKIDLEILCRPILIWSHRANGRNAQINIVKEIQNKFGEEAIDTVLYYGEYLEKMSSFNTYKNTTCLYLKDGTEIISRGECLGTIAKEVKKLGGLTFAPIFIPNGCNVPMLELSAEEYKKVHNHRDEAFSKLLNDIEI